ncbi:MAG: FIST C-terminal domain-containing protein [Halobacteriales archaeon]|nr:FIST C-terminal domain-containing protein [Halobacteriales archaeon]
MYNPRRGFGRDQAFGRLRGPHGTWPAGWAVAAAARGHHAAALPSAGLLFPLSVRNRDGTREVVRTLLNVDEKAQSMTFAGDVPEGSHARLMKANFDRLVDGASGAAQRCAAGLAGSQPGLSILISCVGRKLVLQQRTEEEVEAVRAVLGEGPTTGFYSYGEICPAAPDAGCELHNQTMTITTISEG